MKTPPLSGDLTPTHSLVQTLTLAGQFRAEPGVDESRLGVAHRMGEGTVINGRYTVRRAIGHGGMGWVYDVGDALHPDRAVALKIAKGLGENPTLLSLFKTEFSTMARLDHPNVARVYDFEELRGGADSAITMERIDGAPIDEALKTRDWRVVIDYIVPVCRALSYVHSRRIVHFDLKPANILVDHSAHVKVVDFGIAGGPLGRRRGVIGTPLYIAPELLVGEGGDYRADLYALGVTLYRLLFGETPCPERELSAIARWLSHNRVRVASSARVPAWLTTLVEKLCAPDPADRPRNASAVIEAINTGCGSTYEFETSETRQSYVTTPRFAGRTQELDTILRFVSQRSSGGGGSPALMLTGVSGIGKSRLMKEVRQAAQLQRLLFVEANCYETSLVEFGPIGDVLYQLVPLVESLGDMDLLRDALPALVKMAPRLAHGRTVTGLPQAPDAEGERLQLLQATAGFLLGAARRTPLAIYINDLHWASRAVGDVLAYVAQRVADEEAFGERVPLAILGSYRSDELSGRPVEKAITLLRSRAVAVEVALAPLESADVADLVYSMLGVDDVPDRFLAGIAHETAGNPFFVQEIMRVLFENGSVFLERGKWATTVDVGELQMPTTITEVFRRRLAMLSVDEQKVVCALAVHGRPLSIERLAGALADTGTTGALIALEHKGIVIKHRDGGAEYNVAHDHMRETIYGDLSTADRRLFHARLAEELDRSASGLPQSAKPIDDLARHFRGADISEKALEYSIAAGTRALEQLSHGGAVDHLSYAVAQLDQHDSRQPVVVEAYADALLRSARFADALAEYARVLSLLPLAEDRARVHGKIADTHEKLGEPERSIDQAWTALALLGERPPYSNLRWTLWTLTERAGMLVNEALICQLHGESARADQYFAGAVAIARVQQAGWFLASGLYESGLVLQARGKHSDAAECLREAREIAETGGHMLLLRHCEAALHGSAAA